MKNITIDGEVLSVRPAIYSNNLRICIQIVAEDGPYMGLSTNIMDADIEADEFCVNAWSAPEHIVDQLRDCGLFTDTGKTVPAGHAIAPVWKLTDMELLVAVTVQRDKAEADLATKH